MSITIEALSNYLGRQASALLADQPFKNWIVERSFETGLEKPRIDYVFAQDGIDFVCDGEERVRSIFLYADESRYFREGVLDLPFTLSRQEVMVRFGPPSQSGGGIRDPILGEYGPWDRFARPGYVVHVEYRFDADAIKRLTLMRADAVPK